MARRARTLADNRTKFGLSDRRSNTQRLPDRGVRQGMDMIEVLTAVCKEFCRGHTASKIKTIMGDRYGIKMAREEPYQLISYAASQGWIRFQPPSEEALRDEIQKRNPRLEVEVVHTTVFDDVATRAAEMLVELLVRHRVDPRPGGNPDEVHLGFAGGRALRKVAMAFAAQLRRPIEGLPSTVVLHTLAAGHDVYEPSTDPNAFFTYFVHDPAIHVQTRFVGLHAPALIKTEQFEELRSWKGIREAYEHADELDIIVTSASLWSDEHSMLREYMEQEREDLAALEAAGCIGDMLWRPLGPKGPIDIKTSIRAMTLVELADLPNLIRAGKRVLLVLGPCGGCNAPKGRILKPVLGGQLDPFGRRSHISHLVCDSRAAREYLSET